MRAKMNGPQTAFSKATVSNLQFCSSLFPPHSVFLCHKHITLTAKRESLHFHLDRKLHRPGEIFVIRHFFHRVKARGAFNSHGIRLTTVAQVCSTVAGCRTEQSTFGSPKIFQSLRSLSSGAYTLPTHWVTIVTPCIVSVVTTADIPVQSPLGMVRPSVLE